MKRVFLFALLAAAVFAEDAPKPKSIPLAESDKARFAEILQAARSASQELESMRLRACLVAKLTLEQCGSFNNDGTVQVLEPKPAEAPKAAPVKPEPKK